MKKVDIKIGIKVMKSKIHQPPTGHALRTSYGEIINEPFLEKNSHKGVWRANVKFEDGRIEAIAIARLIERSE